MPEHARSIPRTAYRQERYREPPRQSKRTRESCSFCSQLCRFAMSFECPIRPVMFNGRMAGRLRLQTDEFAVLVEGVFDTDRAVAGWNIRPPTNGGQPTNSAATSIVRACTGARPVAALLSGVLPRYAQASDNRSSVPARDTGSAKDSVPPR